MKRRKRRRRRGGRKEHKASPQYRMGSSPSPSLALP